MQGVGSRIQGTDTMEFVKRNNIPKHKKITYANFVCDYRPLKSEKHRVRMTIGGDKLDYPYDTASPAASLIETKMLLNSVISDSKLGARFFTMDLKDHFLQTIMKEAEYMKIHQRYLTDEITKQYNTHDLVHNDGYVYCKIKRGMYGLKQAARLAYDMIKERLAPHGYKPRPLSPNIWTHDSRKTIFCLCVDDFGVKYYSKADADHLINALKDYKLTIDWTGTNYCGLKIDWDYNNGWVDISMPKYVQKTLTKLNHPKPVKPVTAPHKWSTPAYTKTPQIAPTDTTPLLNDKRKTRIEKIVGSFLYYARAIDSTMLPALSEISGLQAHPTEATEKKANMLLDYLSSTSEAKLRFYASDMILHVDSDAAYLIAPNAKSRIAGYYYLGDLPNKKSNKLNGAIQVECR